MRCCYPCLVLGAVLLSSRVFLRAAAHPLCYFDSRPTDPDEVLVFCPDQEDGACCNDVEEDEVISLFLAAGSLLSTECSDYYKQVRAAYTILVRQVARYSSSPTDLLVLLQGFNLPQTQKQNGTKNFRRMHRHEMLSTTRHAVIWE